jgi:hypothetical protein
MSHLVSIPRDFTVRSTQHDRASMIGIVDGVAWLPLIITIMGVDLGRFGAVLRGEFRVPAP